MRVSEVFHSIQGEGINVGVPMHFVRLFGCNLSCLWCDTLYANQGKYEDLTPEEVFTKLKAQGLQYEKEWVCITGGEPLVQEEELRTLCSLLLGNGNRVEIETNGSLLLPTWRGWIETWVVDYKCPSSGEYGSFDKRNFKVIRPQDCLKFVVANPDDLKVAEEHIRVVANIIVSPVIEGDILSMSDGQRRWLQEVWEFVKKYPWVRFSLQIHKVVFGERKGV